MAHGLLRFDPYRVSKPCSAALSTVSVRLLVPSAEALRLARLAPSQPLPCTPSLVPAAPDDKRPGLRSALGSALGVLQSL